MSKPTDVEISTALNTIAWRTSIAFGKVQPGQPAIDGSIVDTVQRVTDLCVFYLRQIEGAKELDQRRHLFEAHVAASKIGMGDPVSVWRDEIDAWRKGVVVGVDGALELCVRWVEGTRDWVERSAVSPGAADPAECRHRWQVDGTREWAEGVGCETCVHCDAIRPFTGSRA